MCEVLPIIDESSPSPDDGDSSRLEQLMITMLEERDRLMEQLHESQEAYSTATRKLGEVEMDNSVLMRQLQALMPEEEDRLQVLLDEARSSGGVMEATPEEMRKWPVAQRFALIARDLAAAKMNISEKDEEVQELKSERNNTRLLLEHLECLVARHERSLRMTVMKRQQNAGVSSEVEVLKALKSLFDHHKALDEKVRERLRSAQERNLLLEDELLQSNEEMKSLQDENKRLQRMIQQRNSVRLSMCYDNISLTKEQLALLEEKDQSISDLQFSLDERDAQMDEVIHLRDEFAMKLQETEDELAMAIKELQREQQTIKTCNMQMAELVSSRSKMEASLSEMLSQLTDASQELGRLRDQNQQLSDRAANFEAELIKTKAELKQKEATLLQAHVTSEQLKQHSEQLSAAELKRDSTQNKNEELQLALERKQQELMLVQEKEAVNEGHIARLQSTIERMLKESNDRMKTHSVERKALANEKAVYQEKAESREKELLLLQQQNQKLVEQLEELKAEGSVKKQKGSPPKPKVPRNSSPSKIRYSWQITDLDTAIAKSKPSEVDGAVSADSAVIVGAGELIGAGEVKKEDGVEQGGDDSEVWNLGEPEAVSKLMSMLEGQVSKLDQQLESIGGDNLSKASEFDRVLQSMTDGEAYPTLQTMPLSSPPGSRSGSRKYHPESLPSSIYRINNTAAEEEDSPPASTGSNNSFSAKMPKPRSSFSKLFKRKEKGSTYKKNAARRASAPVPQSPRHETAGTVQRESMDFSDFLKSSEDTADERQRKSELLTEILADGVPFADWDAAMVLAWLEVWVGVPFWYIAAIRTIIHSGRVLANLTEAELSQELGITNSLHRLKLTLAVHEIVAITSNHLARTTSLYGEMNHEWIGDYWLTSLGLPQYSDVFKVCLVDARMLEHLTKKDLRTVLKMVDASHRNSLQYGITVLRKIDYNRIELERRRESVNIECRRDVVVWTNAHVISWVESIGLGEYAQHLKDTGVHGGVIALDTDFDYEKLALALQVPITSAEVRRQLRMEFVNLLAEGTSRVTTESQSHGKIVRKLSRRLKVGSRKVIPPNEFMPVRATSPVLYSTQPVPLRMQSLFEADETSSTQTTPTNSVDLSSPASPTELVV